MSPSPQAWDREARRYQRIADERRNNEVARNMKRALRRQRLTDYGLALVILLALTVLILALYLLGVRT